mgnify:FL=1|tara:strand:- start:571 stop:792 length:222 start_codon:yes stop_codon:yes gene_type:complete
MRYVEFTQGYDTFVSGEEQDLIEAIMEKGQVLKNELSEREQKVASNLANKSILIRQRTDEKIYYKISKQTRTP